MNRALPDVCCTTPGKAGSSNDKFFCDAMKFPAMRPSQPTHDDAESVRNFWAHVKRFL